MIRLLQRQGFIEHKPTSASEAAHQQRLLPVGYQFKLVSLQALHDGSLYCVLHHDAIGHVYPGPEVTGFSGLEEDKTPARPIETSGRRPGLIASMGPWGCLYVGGNEEHQRSVEQWREKGYTLWIRGDTGMDGVVRGDALGPSTVFDELHYPGLTYMPSLRSTKGAMGRSAYARGRSLY